MLIADYEDEHTPRNPVGIPLAEATDKAHQYEWDADLPVTDFAMAALHKAQDAYRKGDHVVQNERALLWSVKRRQAIVTSGDPA